MHTIMDTVAIESVKCPSQNCNAIVGDEFIVKLITAQNVQQKYKQIITNNFVLVSESHCVYAILSPEMSKTLYAIGSCLDLFF